MVAKLQSSVTGVSVVSDRRIRGSLVFVVSGLLGGKRSAALAPGGNGHLLVSERLAGLDQMGMTVGIEAGACLGAAASSQCRRVVREETSVGESHVDGAKWRKSTHSETSSGGCVEVGFAGEFVLVRDTKNRTAGFLRFTIAEWVAFVAGVKDGEFELPE
jgi:Domain of unknown function (DUF397)